MESAQSDLRPVDKSGMPQGWQRAVAFGTSHKVLFGVIVATLVLQFFVRLGVMAVSDFQAAPATPAQLQELVNECKPIALQDFKETLESHQLLKATQVEDRISMCESTPQAKAEAVVVNVTSSEDVASYLKGAHTDTVLKSSQLVKVPADLL